jgi:hypothetical protein
MLEIIAFAAWICFGAYAVWYFTSAKRYAPITMTEAKMLWVIHKHDIRCNANRWRELVRGGRVVGFECECGYKHVQRRPIVSSIPVPQADAKVPVPRKLKSPRKLTFEHE